MKEQKQPDYPKFRVKQPVVEMVDIVTQKQGAKTMVQGFVIRELGDEDAFFIPPDDFHKRYEPAEESADSCAEHSSPEQLLHMLAEVRDAILSQFPSDGSSSFYEKWIMATVPCPAEIPHMVREYLTLPKA